MFYYQRLNPLVRVFCNSCVAVVMLLVTVVTSVQTYFFLSVYVVFVKMA